MGINFTHQSSYTQTSPAGLLLHGVFDMDGSSSYTVSNLPTDAKFFRFSFKQVATNYSNNPRWNMRFGSASASSIDSDNNYRWCSGYYDSGNAGAGTNAASSLEILNRNHTSSNHREHGVMDLARSSQGWTIRGQFGDHYYSPGINYNMTGVWMFDTSMSKVQLYSNGGQFRYDSELIVHYMMGN